MTSKISCAVLLFLFAPLLLFAQQKEQNYELLPAPDLWYNDVDGIRLGLRIKGQKPGTFGDGPHRLDFGVWLGTWLPQYPVSYYLSFTEPIPSISDFGSEGNIQLFSSIRTGFHRHGLAFNKRWQTGFNENNFKELSLSLRSEDRFKDAYLLYPRLWIDEWLYISAMDILYQKENGPGLLQAGSFTNINLGGPLPVFVQSKAEIQQLIALNDNFAIRGRLFAGIASEDTPPQYLFSNSFLPAIGWMGNGLTRAKGTIPTSWMDEGLFQVSGGANLRGYLERDFNLLNNGITPLYTSLGALNIEFDYPNPLDKAIKKIPVIGNILDLRSYLFIDTGTSLGLTSLEYEPVLADAGLGFMFSLNIPDYLGKSRGIRIRYDIPLWLSRPGADPHFKYRNIIGIGAVIPL